MELTAVVINNENINDNLYWCSRNLYIDQDKPLVFTRNQLEIFKVNDHKKAFLMPRQSGKTLFICSDALANAVTKPRTNCVIFTPDNICRENVFKKIDNMINYSYLKDIISVIKSRNVYRFQFDNGSEITIRSGSDMLSTRGILANYLYVDDFDYYESEQLSLILSAVSKSDNALVIGTNSIDKVKFLCNE